MKRCGRPLRLGCCVFAVLCPGLADAAPDLVGQVMALMAQRRHGEADFEQVQFLAALRTPLRSHGTLSFDAPDHLEERTFGSHPQSAILDGGELTLRSGSRHRTLQLADFPQLAPLLESIRATLAGDRPSLERHFEITSSGTVDHWQLRLLPRGSPGAPLVRSVRIAGEADAVLEVEIIQADGDHSLMKIQPRP